MAVLPVFPFGPRRHSGMRAFCAQTRNLEEFNRISDSGFDASRRPGMTNV
jgi:hypothetical protein